jgi:outer membrane receptor protein involved in Fe transport
MAKSSPPASGFVAKRSATGRKTDAPLIETPVSVSVVTSAQIEAQNADSLDQAFDYAAGIYSLGGGANVRGFNVTGSAPLYVNGSKFPINSLSGAVEPFPALFVPSAPNSANRDIIQKFGADIVTDLDVGYQLTDNLDVMAGAANVFDQYADRQIASTAATVAAGTNGSDNNGIFPYAYIAPYGTSGRILYVKGTYKF